MIVKDLNAWLGSLSSLFGFKAPVVPPTSADRGPADPRKGPNFDHQEALQAFYIGGEIGVQPFIFQACARREMAATEDAAQTDVK